MEPSAAEQPDPARNGIHLVLAGAGMAHLRFLKQWRRRPIPNVRLTLITEFDRIADHDQVLYAVANNGSIDTGNHSLQMLVRQARCELVVDRIVGLDIEQKAVHCAHLPAQPFDWLSLNVGSIPTESQYWQSSRAVIGIKPWMTLPARIERRLQECRAQSRQLQQSEPLRVAVVSDQPAGVEIASALSLGLANEPSGTIITLIDYNSELLPAASERYRRLAVQLLEERNIQLVRGRRVVDWDDPGIPVLTLDNGLQVLADLTIWAAGSTTAPTTRRFGIGQNEFGFLKQRSTLQSVSSDDIWIVGGVGDLAAASGYNLQERPLMEGRLLIENLRRKSRNRPLKSLEYVTPRLAPLICSDGSLIGHCFGIPIRSRWIPKILR